jgi:hypothetical protein
LILAGLRTEDGEAGFEKIVEGDVGEEVVVVVVEVVKGHGTG